MASCGESNEERSMKETLKTPVDNKEYDFVLEQLEEAVIVKEEEVVEDLGDAERPWESPVIEPPSKEFECDVEEGVQPPRHIMVEDFEEDDQEMDLIIDEFLSTFESSPIGLDMEIKEEEAQPPMPLVNNEEEIELEESYQEEEVEIEEA